MEPDRRQHPRPARPDQLTAPAPGEVFEQHRRVLLGLAYRMLGSRWDAEDVLQDAWLRWQATDHDTIQDPPRFLMTVTTRLAIDRLRQLARRREHYVGTWLPEPFPTATGQLGPAETAERRDTLSLATLRLMEQLTPPERGVYVLREAFTLPYDQIAGILGLRPDHARQLHRRASTRLAHGQPRFTASPPEVGRLVDRFVAAAQTGDRSELEQLLAQDVTLYSDGGGKVRAARQPIHGASKVARFLARLIDRYGAPTTHVIQVNGQPAALMHLNTSWWLIAFQVTAEGATTLLLVVNPDKLQSLLPPDGEHGPI